MAAEKSQPLENNTVKEMDASDLAENLPNYKDTKRLIKTDLEKVIKAWPQLSNEKRKAIVKMIS